MNEVRNYIKVGFLIPEVPVKMDQAAHCHTSFEKKKKN